MPTALVALLGAVLLLRFKLSSTWLVLGGVAAGGLVHLAGLAGMRGDRASSVGSRGPWPTGLLLSAQSSLLLGARHAAGGYEVQDADRLR